MSDQHAFEAERAENDELKETVLQLQQQLQATRELVDVEARNVAYIMVRMLPGRMSTDTAAFIADHRAEMNGAAIDLVMKRMKGGQIWREDVVAVLNLQKRQGGQAREG